MSENYPQEPLSFEEFRRILAAELQIDEGKVVPQAALFEDLLVDSIKMVELMLRLEEMGLALPMEAAWEIQTVEDAYRVYREYAGSAPPRRDAHTARANI